MLVAVYGRRRVGKTYLVRETFGNHFTFYHTGLAKSPMLIDRYDNVIDICEMKFTKEPYEVDAAEDLKIQNRRTRFIEKSKIKKKTRKTFGRYGKIFSHCTRI